MRKSEGLFAAPNSVYYPAVDAGYYVLLDSLCSGQHTIHFTGGLSAFGSFMVDVTYNITIAQ